ncbi:UDP-3-O-(3-hydroxymyristoyl)glucosamine N-acyltransferase [Candidatus Palauibacter sp.]|uniref:UDP-3-O-(3-hydroxymyristoyl)glucosamine N-acyltransferase n=1 Tax=Candidatus Palauibacter sp. TaxID=3101350 RepID=UPI003B5BBB5C
MPAFTVSDLARRLNAEIAGDPDRLLSGVASLGVAGPEDLTFFAREAMRDAVEGTEAGAVLAPRGFHCPGARFSILKVDNPHLCFARIVRLFHPEPEAQPGLHPSARIGTGARIGESVSLAEGVVVEDGARVGRGTQVGPGTLIGRGARVGEDCRIGHAVSILHAVEIGDRVRVHAGARIGTDGFGYAPGPSGAHKVPQIGGCVIGDDVEIGANCTIDRGALDETRIGDRTKLDNLVHVGHNVLIGSDCLIIAQVGIAGSTRIGAGAQLGGQAGIIGHLEIGPGARIAAQSGVIRDVPPGATHGGTPAQPRRSWMKAIAHTRKLPQLVQRVARLERRQGLARSGAEEPADDGTA